MLAFILLLTLQLFQVNGHGQLTVPAPRPDIRGDIKSASQREPSFTLNGIRPTTGGGGSRGYFETDYRCRGYGRDERQERVTLRAGQDFTIEWEFEANHPGDCFLYVSVPGQQIDAPENWFKILSIPGCGATDASNPTPPNFNSLTFTVPEGIPACEECVLRWEWYALHLVSNIEFYSQCADITVVNDLGVGEVDPKSIVSISGTQHLPQNADAYRRAYDREFGPELVVGPDIATLSLSTSEGIGGSVDDLQNDQGNSETIISTTTTILVPTPTATTTTTTTATSTYDELDEDDQASQYTTTTPTETATDTAADVTTTTTVTPEINDTDGNDFACSFDEAGYVIETWNGGFVINHALFSSCAGTTIEFDWQGGSGGCFAQITNYWNADMEVYNNGKTVKFTTLYDSAAFGFLANGAFAIENLRVNGQRCYTY